MINAIGKESKTKIVSGGQTGVDRAALDAALEFGLPCGGSCPKGRRAENGRIDSRYPLMETPSRGYRQRTEFNVRDSDGTLILHRGNIKGGTSLTVKLAKQHWKPLMLIDLTKSPSPESVRCWVAENGIKTLNVAGPRESGEPGIYDAAVTFLKEVLFTYATSK